MNFWETLPLIRIKTNFTHLFCLDLRDEFERVPGAVSVLLGEPVLLPCSPPYGNPQPTVRLVDHILIIWHAKTICMPSNLTTSAISTNYSKLYYWKTVSVPLKRCCCLCCVLPWRLTCGPINIDREIKLSEL